MKYSFSVLADANFYKTANVDAVCMRKSAGNFWYLLFISLDTKKNPKLGDLTAKFPSLPFRNILQRWSFKLMSGLHKFPELDPFQLADVIQWKVWGFRLAFTKLTVGLRQEKKKNASRFWFKNCQLTKYPESGDILGFRSEPYFKSDFWHLHRKKKNPCIVGETEFSKELMKDCPECVENQMFKFEQIF